jgi:cytoskeletal protein CcmA (bactofilin family)
MEETKMGLFKDFKEDFSQAVNELVPGAEDPTAAGNTDNLVVNTLGDEVDVKSELSKLDGLLEQVKDQPEEPVEEKPAGTPLAEELEKLEQLEKLEKVEKATTVDTTKGITREKENKIMSDMPVSAPTNQSTINPNAVTEETSVITASTVLTGDLQSSGSFDIQGTINGNVVCNGKLTVTGTINGNSNSAEFFADVAKIEGEVVSTGTVKVGTGSVIIGNITAASAVIAGAVKGDIDVQGPVVVDTSAVIMGNIKSRSVQINNGAVIEGFCSQCYADIDVQGLFESR